MELWFTEKQTDNLKFSIKIKKHLYSETSKFQKIDFFDSYEVGRFFTLDGIIMLTEIDEFIYHEMITHVALAVNPKVKKVLVIGGGDGGTVRELTKYPNIEQIDLVEIDEMVVRTCMKFLPQTANKLSDKRVKIYYEDGVKFVEKVNNFYDLIIVDSTDPIGPGEGLFTLAFYQNCFQALNEEGILINQHESPYFSTQREEVKRVHKKIKSCFPISKVYQAHIPTYESGHWLFGFAAKKLDPIKDFKGHNFDIETNYYNFALHKGCFALPTYINKMLEEI